MFYNPMQASKYTIQSVIAELSYYRISEFAVYTCFKCFYGVCFQPKYILVQYLISVEDRLKTHCAYIQNDFNTTEAA